MTAPLPGATRLPRNEFLTPILESLDGYRESIGDAEATAAYLQDLPPIPTVPPAPGPVTDKWQRAEDERDAALDKRERWRNRAWGRQRAAIAEHNSILTANLDDVLRRLHLRLVEVLLTATPAANSLIAAGIDTPGEAIDRGRVAEWQQLQAAWPHYDLLRSSQEALMLHVAPNRIWMSAKPSLDGEPPSNLLWIKNLPALWPDWRERGRTRQQFTIQGSSPRPEPWSRPEGAEFLLWGFKAKAVHWIPTTAEFDETFGPNRQHFTIDDDDTEQSDDSAIFDSLLWGPQEAERKRQAQANEKSTSFKGMPPPILA
jgi:hypothetical protein